MNEQESPAARILFVDIETLPNIGYTWQKYEQNVLDFVQQSCIACYSAKWLGEKTFAKALPDYKEYKPGSYDDKALVGDLWKLLDQADIIVAHNGDSFDIKVIQGRFLVHQLPPPSPFKTVDTKKVAKDVGRFNSNKLNDLGLLFGEGEKIKTDFELWKGCIAGDAKSWARMVKYNKRDVDLLEKVYLRLRPYMSRHPNCGVYEEEVVCPKCGSRDLQARGFARTTTRVYQRYQCNACGGWARAVKSERNRGTEVQHAG